MPFTVSITRSFPAEHAIRLYDGSMEPMHGHEWVVTVTVGAAELDSIGVVVDFHDLERQLEDIVSPWRHKRLNDAAVFADLNPTAENVAFVIARALAVKAPTILQSVAVTEAPGCIATWSAS